MRRQPVGPQQPRARNNNQTPSDEAASNPYSSSSPRDLPPDASDIEVNQNEEGDAGDADAPKSEAQEEQKSVPAEKAAAKTMKMSDPPKEDPEDKSNGEEGPLDSQKESSNEDADANEDAEADEEPEAQVEEVFSISGGAAQKKPISDKFFYKEMAKIKEKNKSARGGVLPPKKSASAYIIFQKEKRPEILRQNPKAKVTEVVKEIARCWSLMSKEDRMVYKMEAKRDKERYERELKTLENQSSTIKKPKKCLSAYMIFVKETRPKIVTANPTMGALEVMQEVGRAWQSINEADKKYFKEKADNDKHRYLAESRKFYDEVARIGQAGNDAAGDTSAVSGKKLSGQQAQNDKSKADVALAINNALGCSKQGSSLAGAAQVNQQQSQALGMDEEVMAGKKRLAQQMAKKVLERSPSGLGGNKRASHSSVMAIGLAPSDGISGASFSVSKRMRAESKFTFKPDNGSEEDHLSLDEGNELEFVPNEEVMVGTQINEGEVVNDSDEDEDEGDEVDDDGEVLYNDGQPPETALQFFAKEYRECLEQEYPQARASVLCQVIKKRWKELTLKQKSPFEMLAQQMQDQKKSPAPAAASGKGRGRGGKTGPKASASASANNTSQLSRTNQRLAKEALSIPDGLADDLQASLQHGNQHQQQSQMVAPENQLIVDDNALAANGSKHAHQLHQQQQQSNGVNELEVQGQNNPMIDMNALGAASGGWGGNMGRFSQQMTPQGGQSAAGLHQQNQLNQAALAAIALQNPNSGVNPQLANLLLNQSAAASTQAQQQQMLLGHQSSNEDLLAAAGGGLNWPNDQQLQQQLLHQMATPQQPAAMNQQLIQLQLLMAAQAQQNMLAPGLNLLNQQAALQQLQQQQPQQQAALLNLMQLGASKMAAGNIGFGATPGNNLNVLDMFNVGGAAQQQNLMNSLQKQMETPQFAGMTEMIGDNEINLTALPTAATQPIQNIYIPTHAMEEVNINFNSMLGPSSATLTGHGLNPPQATPNTQAALGSIQNQLFPGQDFQLPASAHQSATFGVNHITGEAASTPQANPQSMFGQDPPAINRVGSNTAFVGHVGNARETDPQISPQIGPLNNNDQSLHAEQSQNATSLMWQHYQLPVKQNTTSAMPRNNSMASNLDRANSGHSVHKNQMNHQTTPNCHSYLTQLKDRETVSGPKGNNTSQQQQQQQQQQQLYGGSNGGAPLTQTNNLDHQGNGTSLTPFLKPTARTNEQSAAMPNAGVMGSPFLKGVQQPAPTHFSNMNFASMITAPNQSTISPMGNFLPPQAQQPHQQQFQFGGQQQTQQQMTTHPSQTQGSSTTILTPQQQLPTPMQQHLQQASTQQQQQQYAQPSPLPQQNQQACGLQQQQQLNTPNGSSHL